MGDYDVGDPVDRKEPMKENSKNLLARLALEYGKFQAEHNRLAADVRERLPGEAAEWDFTVRDLGKKAEVLKGILLETALRVAEMEPRPTDDPQPATVRRPRSRIR